MIEKLRQALNLVIEKYRDLSSSTNELAGHWQMTIFTTTEVNNC